MIVFHIVNPFGPNWLDLQLPCFLEPDSSSVVLSRIDDNSSAISHFQSSCCGLSMASGYENGSLLTYVDVRACALMISLFVEI